MTGYRMLSDRAVRDFRNWVFENPHLIGIPHTAMEWSKDNRGAHDAMPDDPSVRHRLKRAANDVKLAFDKEPGEPRLIDYVDHSLDEEPHAALRAFLMSRGLSDNEIEEACRRLSSVGQDDPPDLPLGGEPRLGGMTRRRPDGNGNSATAMDARSLAMEAAMRIGIDHAQPPSRPGPLPDTSSRSMADFAARFPEVARIKIV